MNIEFTKSFEKTLDQLSSEDKNKIKKQVTNLVDALESGIRPKGLGIRKLRYDFWEIRVTIKIRVIFEMEKELLRFIIVGSHDSIEKFLKTHT